MMYNTSRGSPTKNPMTPPILSPTGVTLVHRHTDDDLRLEEVDEDDGQLSTNNNNSSSKGMKPVLSVRVTPQQQSFKVGGLTIAAPTPDPAAEKNSGKTFSQQAAPRQSLMQRQTSVYGGRQPIFGGNVQAAAPPPPANTPQLLVLSGGDVGNATPQILNKLRKRMGSLAPEAAASQSAAGSATTPHQASSRQSVAFDSTATAEDLIDNTNSRNQRLSGGPGRLVPIMSLAALDPLMKARWRFVRQLYAFIPLVMLIICAICSTALLTGTMWTRQTGTASLTSLAWKEFSPSQGLCVCKSLTQTSCGDADHYFNGVSNLDAMLLCVEFAMLCLLAWELAGFGVFGGPQFLTRAQLAFSLIAVASAGLSLAAFVATYLTRFCGSATFKRQGYQLGWGFYLRGVEILAIIGYVLLVGYTGLGANRGPPAIPLFVVLIIMCVSTFSSLSHSWMTSSDGTEGFGAFARCVCGNVTCSDESRYDSILKFMLVVTIFQFVFFVLGCGIAFLRAVDNLGTTVKMSQALGTAGFVAAIINVIVLYTSMPYSTTCGTVVTTFEGSLSTYWLIACIVAGAIFLMMNGAYVTKTLTPMYEALIIEREAEYTGVRRNYFTAATAAASQQQQQGDPMEATSASIMSTTRQLRPQRELVTIAASQAKREAALAEDVRSFFQAFYWDELQDRRSQLHELAELLEAQEDLQAKTFEGDVKDAKDAARLFDLRKFFF